MILNSVALGLCLSSWLLAEGNGFCLSPVGTNRKSFGQCSLDNKRSIENTYSKSSSSFDFSVFSSAKSRDGSIATTIEEGEEGDKETEVAKNGNTQDQNPFNQQQQEILDETYALNLKIAQLARASSARNKTAAWMAHDILRTQQKFPDTVAYNSVLKAFAKSSSFHNKQAANVAQEILEEMQQLYSEQLVKNQEWYTRLDCCNTDVDGNSSASIEQQQQQQPQQPQQRQNGLNKNKASDNISPLTSEELSAGPPLIRVKPNVRSFSTVMDAWGKQSNPAAAEKAQDLLFELEDIYVDTGDVAMQPNSISYNTVITAWSKAGAGKEGAEKAQSLLDEMIRYKFADVISYNAVLHAWARSGVPDAGKYAEDILRSMHGNGVVPNARTYTTTMDAWSRSFGCPESTKRAMALLSELENLQRQGHPSSAGNKWMKPNCVTYSTVINSLALSKTEPLKAHKAFGLLQRMNRLGKEDFEVRPNRVTYNSVLNACATSCPTAVKKCLEEQGMSSSLPTLPAMVRTIYDQLLTVETRQEPDHFTFGTVLKAVANLFWGEPDQVEFGKQVFLEACQRGQVSFGVLSQLRQAVSADVYRELLPEEAISPDRSEPLMNHIPKEWTRNVKEDKSRRRRNSMNDSGGVGGDVTNNGRA